MTIHKLDEVSHELIVPLDSGKKKNFIRNSEGALKLIVAPGHVGKSYLASINENFVNHDSLIEEKDWKKMSPERVVYYAQKAIVLNLHRLKNKVLLTSATVLVPDHLIGRVWYFQSEMCPEWCFVQEPIYGKYVSEIVPYVFEFDFAEPEDAYNVLELESEDSLAQKLKRLFKGRGFTKNRIDWYNLEEKVLQLTRLNYLPEGQVDDDDLVSMKIDGVFVAVIFSNKDHGTISLIFRNNLVITIRTPHNMAGYICFGELFGGCLYFFSICKFNVKFLTLSSILRSDITFFETFYHELFELYEFNHSKVIVGIMCDVKEFVKYSDRNVLTNLNNDGWIVYSKSIFYRVKTHYTVDVLFDKSNKRFFLSSPGKSKVLLYCEVNEEPKDNGIYEYRIDAHGKRIMLLKNQESGSWRLVNASLKFVRVREDKKFPNSAYNLIGMIKLVNSSLELRK